MILFNEEVRKLEMEPLAGRERLCEGERGVETPKL